MPRAPSGRAVNRPSAMSPMVYHRAGNGMREHNEHNEIESRPQPIEPEEEMLDRQDLHISETCLVRVLF